MYIHGTSPVTQLACELFKEAPAVGYVYIYIHIYIYIYKYIYIYIYIYISGPEAVSTLVAMLQFNQSEKD